MSGPRMHADELDIDAALVRRLVAAQFPQWAALPVEPVLPWGTENALFRLGVDLVVRLPRRSRTAERLEKEGEWLPRLAPALRLAVPVPLGAGAPGDGYPSTWAVYSWLPGVPATAAAPDDERRLATDLAQFVADLQRIDPSGGPTPGEHNFFRGCPLALRDGSTRESIATLASTIDADAVTATWEESLAAPAWERDPVWIHGDLDTRNLLVANGRLRAVIDWGGLGVGDPAADVMVAWKLRSGEAREVFRSNLAVDNATWARARGWVLSQAVMALAYYTPETNPVLVQEAERWLAVALAES
ncbi:MAG TPA: aminoglycoside phosphotransferase family protein [Gaiellaceae bacterium]